MDIYYFMVENKDKIFYIHLYILGNIWSILGNKMNILGNKMNIIGNI